MYNVYVIEISDERGRRLNPKYPNIYVGQTALTPEARFAQHRAGYKASRHLWKGGKGRGQWLGLWLKRRLYGRFNPIETRAEAERLEASLADHLRRGDTRCLLGDTCSGASPRGLGLFLPSRAPGDDYLMLADNAAMQ